MQFQRVINTKETYREMFHILFTLSLQKPGYMLDTQYIHGLVFFFSILVLICQIHAIFPLSPTPSGSNNSVQF